MSTISRLVVKLLPLAVSAKFALELVSNMFNFGNEIGLTVERINFSEFMLSSSLLLILIGVIFTIGLVTGARSVYCWWTDKRDGNAEYRRRAATADQAVVVDPAAALPDRRPQRQKPIAATATAQAPAAQQQQQLQPPPAPIAAKRENNVLFILLFIFSKPAQ